MKDRRRTRRLVGLAEALARGGGGTIHGMFEDWAQTKAAYRLLDSDSVTHASVCGGHFQEVHRRCRRPGRYLLIEDTTSLNFTGLADCRGLGPIGDRSTRARGLLAHTTLAARCESGGGGEPWRLRAVGLLGQSVWARPKVEAKKRGAAEESKANRLSRVRESGRWARVFESSPAPADERVTWVYVADRESDIYEVFDRCEKGGVQWVIRASQDRALEGEDRKIFETVAASPCLGWRTLEITPCGKAKRVIELELRATTVTLRAPWRPGGASADRTMNVVEVREASAPAGEEPVRWVLLTSLPIDTASAAWEGVETYRCRWLIEELHKAMKTGLGVEKSQLSEARKLMVLVGLISATAGFLLDLKLRSRLPNPPPLEPGDIEADTLKVLELKQGKPADGWTTASFIHAIARLGGFLARKHDGHPGWLTIWRGWQSLTLMTDGYRLAQQSQSCG